MSRVTSPYSGKALNHKNGTRPGYEIGNVWRWVEYPALDLVGEDYPYSEGYEGFAIEVLVNPLGEVERAGTMALREHIDRLRSLSGTDPDTLEAIDRSEDEYLRVVAPRVRAWNATQDSRPIPAPGETNKPDAWMAFRVIPEYLCGWVTTVLRQVTVPKRPTRALSNAGPTAISTPSATPPEQERPAS